MNTLTALPADAIGVIIGFMPDSRPLALTCRGIYAVYECAPDILYWTTSDAAFMLEKQAVCAKFTRVDIIAGDNLPVFKLLEPSSHDLGYVLECDAVNIFRYMYGDESDYEIDLVEDAITDGAIKILRHIGCTDVGYRSFSSFSAFSRVRKERYVRGDVDIYKYMIRELAGESANMDYEVTGAVYLTLRSDTPLIDWRTVVRYGRVSTVREYFEGTKTAITPIMLAFSAQFASFEYMYEAAGYNMPFLLHVSPYAWSYSNLLFYRRHGVEKRYGGDWCEMSIAEKNPERLRNTCEHFRVYNMAAVEAIAGKISLHNVSLTVQNALHIVKTRGGAEFRPFERDFVKRFAHGSSRAEVEAMIRHFGRYTDTSDWFAYAQARLKQ